MFRLKTGGDGKQADENKLLLPSPTKRKGEQEYSPF